MDTRVWYIPARSNIIEKNVGIYCRVSSNDREQLNSLAEQISALTRAVSNVSQWKLCDTFIDICSAKGESKRKEFERMLQECEAHNISVILTKSISRFGRDTVNTLEALKRLKAAGTRVIFQDENLDTADAGNDMIVSVLESLSQAENESRSENIRLGMSFRAATGTSGFYKRILYGYTKDEKGNLFIQKDQASAVRDIFRWYINGDSILGIVKRLAESKVPSPSGKEKWSKRSVEIILGNEKYTGVVRLTDSYTREHDYLIKEHHPPIITEDVFLDAQEEKRRRSNIIVDENGKHRSDKKYSSKKK